MLGHRATGALALVALVGMGGCGGGGEQRPLGSTSLVAYHRSGGIAGSNVDVIVDNGGSTTVTAAGPTGSRRNSMTLDPSRLAHLRRLMAAAPLSSLPEAQQPGCADCYRYQLTYGGARYSTDEASVPAPLRPVIADLESIVASAAPPTPAGK